MRASLPRRDDSFNVLDIALLYRIVCHTGECGVTMTAKPHNGGADESALTFGSCLSARAGSHRVFSNGPRHHHRYVSDATGAVLPGATVEAKNVGTGAVYTAGSSETGNFTLAQLPAGIYDVSALLPGFKKFVRPGIIVQVAQVVRVD